MTQPDAPNRVVQRAATLLLVRDGPSGLEVYLLKRPARGAFPGLHVFTGGKVDAEDTTLARLASPLPDAESANELLDVDADALAYWACAVRECFEESGVVLARRDAEPVDPQIAATLSGRRDEPFVALLREQRLQLTFDRLHYFSHWITPEIAPRRFDTRFFVAELPAGQIARHAPGETVGGQWLAPAEALRLAASDQLAMIKPTMVSLESLARYASVAELLRAVARFEHLPEYSEVLRREGMQPRIDPARR
ncbi:MAG: NUDIX hydrolase [Pseudomonadota bacterium]